MQTNHNAKPFDSIQVGPGLNKGFKKDGSGGFNSSLEARHRWQPKTVDELRTKNNPKQSYKGQVLGAKGIGERANIGDMEKNRPDTFYIQSADRWLTTTGAGGEKQTSRAENILRDVNRINQVKEHFGGGALGWRGRGTMGCCNFDRCSFKLSFSHNEATILQSQAKSHSEQNPRESVHVGLCGVWCM